MKDSLYCDNLYIAIPSSVVTSLFALLVLIDCEPLFEVIDDARLYHFHDIVVNSLTHSHSMSN